MTRAQKRLQREFFQKAGPNVEVFKAMFDTLPDATFYIMDDQDRIMAFNRRNCENCNLRDESEAIGKRSSDLFPPVLADVYMARDREVREVGRPIVNHVYAHGADRSTDLRIVNIYPLKDARGKIIGTACIYRTVSSADSVPGWYDRIKNVIAHIDAHYAEQISLADLAKIASLSQTQFRRLFLRVMEMTPGRYITTIRLNAARKLLTTTDMLISDIATEVGFWDQSHFVKAFKRERALTPSQYRKRHWTT